MKKTITVIGLGLVCLTANAQESSNNVILDYTSISLGYMHHSDIGGIDDLNANGLGVGVSHQFNNLVVGFGIGNSWIDDIYTHGGVVTDLNILQIGGGLGYVFEVSENMHIVPSLSIDYERLHDWDYYYADGWVFTPSISLNYAVNDTWGTSVSIGYADPFNTDVLGWDVDKWTEGTTVFGLSTTWALDNNMGVSLGAGFTENGFNGIVASLSIHH